MSTKEELLKRLSEGVLEMEEIRGAAGFQQGGFAFLYSQGSTGTGRVPS